MRSSEIIFPIARANRKFDRQTKSAGFSNSLTRKMSERNSVLRRPFLIEIHQYKDRNQYAREVYMPARIFGSAFKSSGHASFFNLLVF
jgi:hypothetical protein